MDLPALARAGGLALLAPLACSLDVRALDLDGDGYFATDCDDTNDKIYPGATETCDGADDNCNAVIDEGSECQGLTTDDARVAIAGEGTLGSFMTTGQLDGDPFADLLVQARFGGSSGACLVPGARLVDGVAGGVGDTADVADVGSCWIVDGAMIGLATTSAAPFGEPTSDVSWVLSDEDGLCAVDPYGVGVTLGEAAFGCTSLDVWATLDGTTTGQILSFSAADPSTAALMARTADGVGVARPTGLADDPGAFWAIETSTPLVDVRGGDDLDGDGVADIVAADSSDIWVISTGLNLSAPIEIAGTVHIVASGSLGLYLPGDLDADGVGDFAVQKTDGVEIYSGGVQYSTIYGVTDFESAGDFNGDGRADAAARQTTTTIVSVLLGPIAGGSFGAEASVQMIGDAPTFGTTLAAADVDHDGLSDVWILDTGTELAADTGFAGASVAGTVYLLNGFPIQAL